MIQTLISSETMVEAYHYPVMYKEILDYLKVKESRTIVDCTVGVGSLAAKMFDFMPRGALLVGIDRDDDSLAVARQRLIAYREKLTLYKADFSDLDHVMNDLHIDGVDAFIFDLGISTYQLSNPDRGFSFLKEGPLDMRMDQDSFICAYDLVNNLSETELGNIFKKFGEERYYRKIAHFLVQVRKDKPITTTLQLAHIVNDVVGPKYRSFKIHPATRVFQSLRIAVNRELLALESGLHKAVSFLNQGGRIAVLSFHSLEDRIVKHTLKDFASRGELKIITKKPIFPSEKETQDNPASRSAKLRVAEKL